MSEVLSIGSIQGRWSPGMSTWREAIRSLSLGITQAREGVKSVLGVNVVFHVPGDILQPEFEGVRTGTFSKKNSLLMVQVALPEKPLSDVNAYLRARTVEALDEAERWARKKKIASDLSHLRRIVDA
jgi:hypothetical protein